MILVLFLTGLILGSFINVLVLRLGTGESPFRGRSRCLSCLETLRWYDLVPLLSYTVIWGRCRYCKSGISAQYPIVELLSGALLATLGFFLNPIASPVHFILVGAFFLALLAISVYDLRHLIVPDELSLALLFIAVLFEGYTIGADGTLRVFLYDLLPALLAFSFFGGIWLLSGGNWMGFGDAKLAFSMGLFLGYPGILFAVLFAFWSGAVVGVFLLATGRATRKTEVPFVPFLAFGAFAAYVFMVLATSIPTELGFL